ncbi:LOW QUALITY PROTEIN: TadE-like protein [Delftia sp. 60]|nr:LOW QUALITY PROTEIN: TadE-like protein [Burkholderiales bacterium 23]PIF65611.1 LOW QUALITY PROTEIN: TadE-like protein [Delftia sp. 60]
MTRRQPRAHRFHRSASLRQRGVYALEWAIIFPVFFALLYACISYGLAFLVRESMQAAAEDAARATLRYQTSRSARLDAARSLVQQRLDWLPADLRPTAGSIDVRICRLQNSELCSATLTCGVLVAERCMVRVGFTIPYGTSPIAPALPGFGLVMPTTLTASANIMVDRGGL